MSKINKKYTVSVRGIMYVQEDIISVEHEESGELIPIANLLEDFDGKECNLTVAYAENID